MSTLICPFCQKPLSDSGTKSYICEQNHSFDISKEGYINLLPVNKKKSKSPGDNEMMISARRMFLESGYYDTLIESLVSLIANEFSFENNEFSVLDSGCGEGYYSEKVFNNIPNLSAKVFGTDISKFAIKSAAKKYKNNFYFVSSVYNLPIADNSIDVVLSIFAPIHPEEFYRVLSNKGYVIVVSPAENHLKELAELIYDNFRPHENNTTVEMPTLFEKHLSKRTTFEIEIKDSETLLALLKMTPYYWNTSKESMEKLNNCNDINITCDFNITVFKPLNFDTKISD